MKLCNSLLGTNYFFSKAYLNQHLNASHQEHNNLVNYNYGILGCKIELKQRLSHWKLQFSNDYQQFIDRADKFLDHDFNLLGSGPMNLSFPCHPTGVQGIKYNFRPSIEPSKPPFMPDSYQCIDWHVDFRSGYRWDPSKYYPSSRKYTEAKAADIKLPWELSRCQHLPMLSIAFLLTDKKEYAMEVYYQITDWITNNPLCMGPNWNCPMDVAIRVSNWFVALEALEGFIPDEYDKYQKIISASLVQHFDYLKNNFEWTNKLTSNHYLSDIAGFAFCTQYIPHLKSRIKYAEFAKKELQAELAKQMYEDGMNAEGSLYYHRLVLELFSYTSCLQENHFLLGHPKFNNQLGKCFEFTKEVIRPDNRMPQIGDNDSGLFLNLSGIGLDDMNYLFVLGARLFPGSGYESLVEPNSLAAIILNVTPTRNEIASPVKKATCFKKSGLAVLKTDSMYLSFYCGLNGQKGNGGHCHNDRLSFTLWYRGQDLFVDGGTGFYTSFPEIRNKFRSTMFHNTVGVCEEEQNRFYEDGYLFGCYEDVTKPEISMDTQSDELFRLSGSHDGYSRLTPPTEHQRNIEFCDYKRIITITDNISSSNNSVACFNIKKHLGLSATEKGITSPLFCMNFTGANFVEVFDEDYSPSYGEIDSEASILVRVGFNNVLTSTISLKN